jgi:hypothetical protein
MVAESAKLNKTAGNRKLPGEQSELPSIALATKSSQK